MAIRPAVLLVRETNAVDPVLRTGVEGGGRRGDAGPRVPPFWVRATARLPPTVPSAQPSWAETKVTEAASKPAIGVGAGVAGAAVAGGEVVPAGEPDAVGADVGVPLCDGVGWVVVPRTRRRAP